MKWFIFFLLAFSPFMVKAQTSWNLVVDDNYSHNLSHVTDVGLFQGSTILISGSLSNASCRYQNLFAYNTEGHRLWSIKGPHDLIYTDSEYIYTTGFTFIDGVFGYDEIVLSKYNKNGEEIFTIGYPEVPHDLNLEFRPKSIDMAPDGTILVSSKNSIAKSNVNGKAIQVYEVNLDYSIDAVHAITPSSYLIHTENKLYKSDSSFTLVDSIEFSTSVNKLIVENNTVFTLLDSLLLLLDTDLNILDTLISSPVDFLDMEFYDNTLWLQTIEADSLKLIKLQAFENPDTLTFPVFVNSIKSIVSEGGFTFVGNSFSNQIGIYHYPTHNGEVETVDLPNVELVDFDIYNIEIKYVQIPGDSFAEGYYFNTALTIKNHGIDPISSMAVFARLNGGINCARNFLYKKPTDFDILPGETHTLHLSRAYQIGVTSNQICMRCLAPNSKLETIIDDNYLCKTFVITGTENVTQNPFKVYPNPVTGYLIIENPNLDFKNIEIFDVNGRIWISEEISGALTKIETAKLIPGPYVVRISSDSQINTQLIIKK